MPIRRALPTLVVCLFGLLAVPRTASAEWYLAVYLGGNHTLDSTVSIREPSRNLSIDFHDVQFAAQPNYPRRYYGWRVGKMFGAGRSFGIEFEHIHMKALADTSLSYDVEVGAGTVLPPGGAKPMNNVVEEYQMTHGLNLTFVNLVMRRPLNSSGKLALVLRGGAGPSFPHAESTVLGEVRHEYQFAGFDAQGAAGLQIQLPYRLSVVTDTSSPTRGRRSHSRKATVGCTRSRTTSWRAWRWGSRSRPACRLGPIL